MKKKNYTVGERTDAQFHAMELKKKGYYVFRITEENEVGDKITIAFGYSQSFFPEVKECKEVSSKVAKEENYDFIYYN